MDKPVREEGDRLKRAKIGAAVRAAVPTSVLAFIPIWLQSEFYSQYGWLLFFGVPLVLGFLCSVFLGMERGGDLRGAKEATLMACGIIGAGLLVVAYEGICCLLMAVPLAVPLALLGSWIGIQFYSALGPGQPPRITVSLAILLPLALVSIPLAAEREDRIIQTRWILNSTPDEVWPYLLNLEDIRPPEDRVFLFGMAYPTSTRTKGTERFCELNTGSMPEKIVAIQPKRLLRFEVLATPPSMTEWNPFGEVRASHLTSAFQSRWGEFRLRPLPNGRTEIVASSAYTHAFAPAPYWNLWTDAVVRGVHRQVVTEIQRRTMRPH